MTIPYKVLSVMEQFKVSRTRADNMIKNKCLSLADYRKLVKERKSKLKNKVATPKKETTVVVQNNNRKKR
jgi:hypothetical protein